MTDLIFPAVGIQLTAIPVLSYAMAHNRIPIVDQLHLESDANRQGALVRVAVRDSEGVLSSPYERVVDLVAGVPTTLSDVTLAVDPAAMLQVEEQRPGVITVDVICDGIVVGSHQETVQLLAARQWLRVPPVLSLEMLAAFVMPNDPAIATLVDEAALLLEARTGSPSIQGYQSGVERVDAIAAALFDAMQARKIRYSEPPASWADQGQKVRTPSEVLDGRTGTCLDTVVVLAAAFEQAGIRPLLWLVEGHAFLGYWREESSLDAIAQTDVADVVNLIDLGLVRLVETTMVTAEQQAATYEETHRPPYITYLTGDLDSVLGVTDVWTARQNGIVPLPARRQTADGTVQVVEYRPTEHSVHATALRAGTVERPPNSDSAPVPPRVQQWKNALLDLSLRNRLINYSDRAGVQITVPDGHLAAIEDCLHDRQPIHLLPADQIDDVHRARGVRTGQELPPPQLSQLLMTKRAVYTGQLSGGYPTRMRGLAYKARTIVEETGANNLYLALGSLVWTLDGKALRSPLVLVPVRLVTRARTFAYRLELDESGASTPNYCLLEKLQQVHGLKVPGLAVPETDAAGIDLDAALNAMRVALAEQGLPYRVEATADLSILQFAKFRLWKDLDEHWPTLMQNALVSHLVGTPTDPFVDPAHLAESAPDLDELDAVCPVPGDASQLSAVADAVAGRTFVLEGPPGTGKSQTITNLLTRAVAEGQRVLFVAEKRAALDVVRSRLDAVGIGAFSLDLHDKGSKPAVVRAQIKAALDHAVAVDDQGLSAQQEDLRSSRRTLSRYAHRLHEANEVGFSYYSARTKLLALGEGDVLPVPLGFLNGTEALKRVQRVEGVLRTLPDTADSARPSLDHPWGFVELSDPETLDIERIRAAVSDVDTAVDTLPMQGALIDVLIAARTADDLSALASILQAPNVPLTVLDTTRTEEWQRASAALGREMVAFVSAAHPGLDVATPAALELPLADIHAQAQAAASSSWFGRSKRLRAVLTQVQPALRAGVEVKPRRVPELTGALLQVQTAVRALAAHASGVAGVQVPEVWNPLTAEGQRLVESQVSWLTWAGAAVDSARRGEQSTTFVTALRGFLDANSAGDPLAANSVHHVAKTFRSLADACLTGPATLDRWCSNLGLLQRWTATRPHRTTSDPALLSLRRWVSFVAHLHPLTAAGLGETRELLLTGSVHSDDAVRAFERGLVSAAVDERRSATGLDGFDPVSHGRAIVRFTESAQSVRAQMSTAVPAQVLSSRPFQASTARGQVGALQRELSRQRGGLGVRALLATYGELITQLMPCVLVSPDSLARFFPVGDRTFDLVVFDEASQIRVADAVGAMGRSSSVVVVGDSKQMPPTSFAEPALLADDDLEVEEVIVAADEESILTECVLARVPQRWLSWHYRSQDESLIAFSNQHYYEGRLSSFPAPTGGRAHAGIDGFGISLVPVAGTFHRSGKGKLLRTNPVEADAVLAEIRRRFDASPEAAPSIGVVTFNQQQRAYIEALLRDAGDDRLVEALDGTEGEGLFVKNLENVQGDERDVILFSTAFSVNAKGVLPLNFGPLNRAGGERRLNVAVTRARRQVVVFSSFAPQQLRAEETSSVGIKHLRAYLDFASAGAATFETAARSTAAPDRHRQEVAERLRSRGLVVKEELGLSEFKIDLSLAHPDEPDRLLVAALLDGPGWRARQTVGDRDGLPVEVLSHMLRWPRVERVWLPEWLTSADGVLDRLEAAVHAASTMPETTQAAISANTSAELANTPFAEHALTGVPLRSSMMSSQWLDDGPGIVRGSMTPQSLAVPESSSAAPLIGEEPFVAWVVHWRGDRYALDQLPYSAGEVRAAIKELVAAEGPVHLDRLARLVAAAFGLSRVNASRAQSIIDQVPPALLPDPSEPFAWPTGRRPDEWIGFRRASEDEPRSVEDVSLRELGNAMVALSSATAGMERQELLRETLLLLGGRRLTPGIEERLASALEQAVDQGRLKPEASGLYVVV